MTYILGISKTIRRLIADAMASHLLEPRRMVIPMACSDVSTYKFPIPKHLLLLKVIEAKVGFFLQQHHFGIWHLKNPIRN